MTTIDLTTTARPNTPRLTRLERVRWAAGPLALVAGPALAIVGFALHPQAMGDRQFVAWTNAHATQFAAAHLLIGSGLAIAAVGVWAALRLAHGKRGTVLVAGTLAMFLGTVGMGYDHLAHGALGYALASDSSVPLGMSTHVQVGFETLPYVGWAGLASAACCSASALSCRDASPPGVRSSCSSAPSASWSPAPAPSSSSAPRR
jgi:hypothetical protein